MAAVQLHRRRALPQGIARSCAATDIVGERSDPAGDCSLPSINEQLREATHEQILEWAIDNLPGLYQTTAFGVTGCVTMDQWGPQLWRRTRRRTTTLSKVEPARRAYEELGVKAVFTGRRKSQGADRSDLQAVEVDETGLVKVKPFLNWSFGQVDSYVKTNAVPYNELLDMGFKSIGDWHSTSMPGADGGERSGRWKDKGGKTECGLHKDYFKMKRVAEKKLREAELARKDAEKDEAEVAKA
ncbi:hypothetical protein L7F22_064665 [Adiantum nelumboides]|nr:hypothetical protein [Adiantum nelumboides]